MHMLETIRQSILDNKDHGTILLEGSEESIRYIFETEFIEYDFKIAAVTKHDMVLVEYELR